MTSNNSNTATPFLSAAANFYNTVPNLEEYSFVFPNRRSGQFFANNLKLLSKGATILPEITTIADFLSSITHETPISSVEAMFILFSCYKEKIDANAEFDKFAYWGDTLLNDFNEVDMYMVDAQKLFSNIQEFKEIATDYLDDDLKQALNEFFNLNVRQYDNGRLWKADNKQNNDDSNVQARFMRMWEQLYPLYSTFKAQLQDKDLSYTGMMYRNAVSTVRDMHAEEFPSKHYVFVGFNILSTSQIAIFKALKDKGIADFLWDFNSPAFNEKDNKGAKFISFYKKLFPQPAGFCENKITAFPHITVTGVPSNVGQVKYAISIVQKLIAGKDDSEKEHILNDTAIILPDENLFIPLVNTLSPDITDTNITLGYPLSGSSIVSLMRTVSATHKRAYHDKTSDQWFFLRNDVLNVLSHPIIKTHFPKLAIELVNKIKTGNLYKVAQSILTETDLAPLFETVTESTDSITAYLSRLASFAQSLKTGKPIADNDTADNDTPCLQDAFIDAYTDVLTELKLTLTKHNLSTQKLPTLFHLIDKLAGKHTVPFEGEPLKGLQIMGVLETRCLDFKNVIILSMNDSVFPRKHFTSPSFISEYLRRGYHMSNSDDQEAMPTYYFYRLISRADNVELIYNSSSADAAASEWSRFITQLQKIYNQSMTMQKASSKIKPATDVKISIVHTDLMDSYFANDSENYLSASSINEYIKCPLKFYFHHIQHLSDDNPESDFMDASTKGTIVHNTLQALYAPSDKSHKIVTLLDILNFTHKKNLDAVLTQNINAEFVHSTDLDAPLTGEAKIIFEPLKQYVLNAIEFDVKLLDDEVSVYNPIPKDSDTLAEYKQKYFEVYECEQSHKVRLTVTNKNGNSITFNLTYKPDRIDSINGTGTVRLIDYKTGGDETSFGAIKNMFPTDNKSAKHPHAILQQFLYANAYLQEHKDVNEIQPMLYTMGGHNKFGIFCTGKDDKDKFNCNAKTGNVIIRRDNDKDKDEANKEFNDLLYDLLTEMKSPDELFFQADKNGDYGPCKYCNFTDFCRR